jgi:L-threonylcarbamoyladenylate synthase
MIVPPQEGIALAVGALKRNDVVALPTETVYGLAGGALRQEAVRKIFGVKGRPLIDPLIVHVLDVGWIESLVTSISEGASILIDAFWPGPLTLVLDKKIGVVPDVVTAGKPSVAIRCPKHPIFREILAAFGESIAAPSANPFGYISPTRAEHVQASLGERVSVIIDGGPCAFGLESTIVDVRQNVPITILRPGPITQEAIEAILGHAIHRYVSSSHKDGYIAPGLMKKHYSPSTTFKLLPSIADAYDLPCNTHQKIAVVHYFRPKSIPKSLHIDTFWLAEPSDTFELAASNLFHLLQTLDQQNFHTIFMQKAPNLGVGVAINDRLGRASF